MPVLRAPEEAWHSFTADPAPAPVPKAPEEEHCALVAIPALMPVPTRTSLVSSSANVRVLSDLSSNVDVELAAIHTQVWKCLSPFLEEVGEHSGCMVLPVSSLLVPTPPPFSAQPSGHSAASSPAISVILSLSVVSVGPPECMSANEVMSALVLEVAVSAPLPPCWPIHRAAAIAAASLAVCCHDFSSFSHTDPVSVGVFCCCVGW